MGWRDAFVPEDEEQKKGRSWRDHFEEEEPPSKLRQLPGRFVDDFKRDFSDPKRAARRLLRANPITGGLMGGLEEIAALTGSERLYEAVTGEDYLSEEELAQLPPQKAAELRRRQTTSTFLPVRRGPEGLELAAPNVVEDVKATVEGIGDLPEFARALKERPLETLEATAGETAESVYETGLRGGLRREAPLSSTLDTLGLAPVPGVIGTGARLPAKLLEKGGHAGSRSLSRYADALRADEAIKAAKSRRKIEQGRGIQATRESPYHPRVQAARELLVEEKRRAARAALAQGDPDAVTVTGRGVEGVKAQQAQVRALEALRRGDPWARPHYQAAGQARLNEKVARGALEEALDDPGAAKLFDVRQGLEGKLRGALFAGGAGGAAAAGFIDPMTAAALLGGRAVLRKALSSPRAAETTAQALLSLAEKSGALQRYLPQLRARLGATGGAVGAVRMLEEHSRLMDEDPAYRMAVERAARLYGGEAGTAGGAGLLHQSAPLSHGR